MCSVRSGFVPVLLGAAWCCVWHKKTLPSHEVGTMEGGAWPDLSGGAGRRRKYEDSGHGKTLSPTVRSVNV